MPHARALIVTLTVASACLPDAELADERRSPMAPASTPPAPGGTPVAPAPIVDDGAPPTVDALTIAIDDCAHLRASASKRTDAVVVFRSDADEAAVPLGPAGPVIDFLVPWPPWAGGRNVAVTLRLADASGRQVEAAADVRAPVAPPLVITEVLANPAGSEYTQEFVELRNTGSVDVSLGGLALEDATAADVLPAVTLAAGARALVVAAAFDPTAGEDPPPAPGTVVVRVEGRIGRDGLSNGGEAVRLRTVDGTLVTAYGGWVDVGASIWNGRSVHRAPDAPDACDRASAWTTRPMPPTPGW